MQPDSLIKLVTTGNVRTVEEEWMLLMESPEKSAAELAQYAGVLSALCDARSGEQAGALAWAALEALSERFEPDALLPIAGAFLLAVGNHQEMRTQVAEMYRTVFADVDGLEGLIDAAGLAGGRPVRRALRTLDVCLALKKGTFLRARDEDAAARVVEVDASAWEIEVATPDGGERYEAVLLADRYEPASEEDFTVRRVFFQEELQEMLSKHPASIITQIVLARGGALSRDELEAVMVPALVRAADWKKWWTRARAALKKLPNVELERKAPYTIAVHENARAAEKMHLDAFHRTHDPRALYNAIEDYLRECKLRSEEPSKEILCDCFEKIKVRAERAAESGGSQAGVLSVLARHIGDVAGVDSAADPARDVFRNASDLEALFGAIGVDGLHGLACQTLTEASPDTWQADMIRLFPSFPMSACDREAKRLFDAGCGREDFAGITERAFADPVRCFEMVLWLWNGPAVGVEAISEKPLITILGRVLRTLVEVGRNDAVDREWSKAVATRTRAVLAARKSERFKQCLGQIELSMASALQNQLRRLDGLGRATREDLLHLLRSSFPALETKPKVVEPWKREDVLYVTREGFAKKQKEIDHHVNVKMKENARAIGAAAERGDLSENSEYKFALEERDLLRARLAQMNSEMALAEILEEDAVPTDHVGIGSKVVFRNAADGSEFVMSVLGPWDSDLDEGFYNYQAPLAQQVLGAKTGDSFDFDHGKAKGRYEIVGISNALADATTDAPNAAAAVEK